MIEGLAALHKRGIVTVGWVPGYRHPLHGSHGGFNSLSVHQFKGKRMDGSGNAVRVSDVAAMHRDIAACWRDTCGRPELAAEHEAAAVVVEVAGEILTRAERVLDRVGMMAEVLEGYRKRF